MEEIRARLELAPLPRFPNDEPQDPRLPTEEELVHLSDAVAAPFTNTNEHRMYREYAQMTTAYTNNLRFNITLLNYRRQRTPQDESDLEWLENEQRKYQCVDNAIMDAGAPNLCGRCFQL